LEGTLHPVNDTGYIRETRYGVETTMEDIERHTIVQSGLSTSMTRERAPARSWVCRVTSGKEEGRTVTVGGRRVLVGADAACDLILSDPTVSRNHVELQASPDGIRVRDLGSTNGTYYQSSRLTEAVLPGGASIRVGEITIQFLASSPVVVPPSNRKRFGGLVGESLLMRELFAVLDLASPTEATILIEGESGTGKELAARAIHDHSHHAQGPFVVLDCSATQETLIESQMFGHCRGAFTGAVSKRNGAFAEANKGTLFLDEVGELPIASQAKLLRAIEAHTISPLGSDQSVNVDVRVIAATNRDLHCMVEQKTFRFDLFQRLAVVYVRIPSLRERLEDLTCLIRNFYEGRSVDPGEVAGENLQKMKQVDWPGNIRELRNVLERAWVLSGEGTPKFQDLRLWFQQTSEASQAEPMDIGLPFKEAKEKWIEKFEQRYIASLFSSCNHNISEAARIAGINRNHFSKLLAKYGIEKP
jgi:DNA-binding NtrC family response regulator